MRNRVRGLDRFDRVCSLLLVERVVTLTIPVDIADGRAARAIPRGGKCGAFFSTFADATMT